MEIINKDWLTKVIFEINFVEVFSQINPHTPDASKKLENLIAIKAESLRTLLLEKFPDKDEKIIFQNVLAIAYENPVLLICSWRTLLEASKVNKILLDEVERLSEAINKSKLAKTGLKILLENKITQIPTIEAIDGITPALNFRYWLASQKIDDIDVVDCIRFPQINKKISRLAWQREMKNLLEKKKGNLVSPIDKAAFEKLSDSEKMLLISDVKIFNQLTIEIGSREKIFLKLKSIFENQIILTKTIFEALRCIQKRRLFRANEILDSINIEHYHGGLAARFMPIFRKKITTYVYPDIDIWEHIDPKNLDTLCKLCGDKKIPAYLTYSAEKICELLAERKLMVSEILTKDFLIIQKTWGRKEELLLVRNGIYEALESISNEVVIDLLPKLIESTNTKQPSNIVLTALGKFISTNDHFETLIPYVIDENYPVFRDLFQYYGECYREKYFKTLIKYYGSNCDISFIDSSKGSDISALIEFLNDPSVIDPKNYRIELSNAIACKLIEHLPKLKPYSRLQANAFILWSNLASSFIRHCPEGSEYLSLSLKSDQIIALLNEPLLPMNLWNMFINSVKEVPTQKSLRIQKLGQIDSVEFLKQIREYPEVIDKIGKQYAKSFKLLKNDQDRIATVICLRKIPKSLKKLQAYWTKQEFTAASMSACEYLPPKSRQRAYLSLIANLDKSVTLPLAALMSSSKKDASAGNKFNHLYNSFEIPKKNGKKRTITAPSPILKKVQKSVLNHLLNPIKIHPAAHGFKKSKSILTNATPHVNKEIVANCDVADCFPSVSWPLIYRALKISFENSIGIEAVSLLTDICSKNGSLPMGAPTSPALLNIILFRTDEILSNEASKSNCSYTRYADDLTFSGDEKAIKLIGIAKFTLNRIGLNIDPNKTNIFRRGRRQSVTGLVVNERISVNKKFRKLVRAAQHNIVIDKDPTWLGKPTTRSSIQGRVDFINYIHKQPNEKKD